MDTVLKGSSRVTSRGQITIPQELREKLDIKPGDHVYFIEQNGNIVIQKGPLHLT